jgi:hypothetical protein
LSCRSEYLSLVVVIISIIPGGGTRLVWRLVWALLVMLFSVHNAIRFPILACALRRELCAVFALSESNFCLALDLPGKGKKASIWLTEKGGLRDAG